MAIFWATYPRGSCSGTQAGPLLSSAWARAFSSCLRDKLRCRAALASTRLGKPNARQKAARRNPWDRALIDFSVSRVKRHVVDNTGDRACPYYVYPSPARRFLNRLERMRCLNPRPRRLDGRLGPRPTSSGTMGKPKKQEWRAREGSRSAHELGDESWGNRLSVAATADRNV